MLFPACGVIAGNLVTSRKTGKKYPVAAYTLILAFTFLAVVLSLLSVFFPANTILENTAMEMTPYNMAVQLIVLPVSLAAFILFLTASREKKENAGTIRKNILKSIIMIIVFLIIYSARIFLGYMIDELTGNGGIEELNKFLEGFMTLSTMGMLGLTIINYPLTFTLFFGEEYGWRYFLQPRMQEKFGMRKGVLLLGLIWGLWHTPMNFMYYTTTCGPQSLCNQIIVCVAYAIFFGYAYMKTENIWVPVAIHYLNNNLIPVVKQDVSVDVLQHQEIKWSDIPPAALLMIVYVLFIFASEYRSKKSVRSKESAAES